MYSQAAHRISFCVDFIRDIKQSSLSFDKWERNQHRLFFKRGNEVIQIQCRLVVIALQTRIKHYSHSYMHSIQLAFSCLVRVLCVCFTRSVLHPPLYLFHSLFFTIYPCQGVSWLPSNRKITALEHRWRKRKYCWFSFSCCPLTHTNSIVLFVAECVEVRKSDMCIYAVITSFWSSFSLWC